MPTKASWSLAAIAVVALQQTAFGQAVTIQQPVVGNFSAATTVSVPDRGTGLVGGVSAGGASRKQYGPFPSGTNSGSFARQSNVTVSARIHDFEELDRLALSAPSAAPELPSSLAAAHAAQTLIDRHKSREILTRKPTPERAMARRGESPPGNAAKARDYLERGTRAEERGEVEKAKFYFRLARRYGSAAAESRLAELASQASRSEARK